MVGQQRNFERTLLFWSDGVCLPAYDDDRQYDAMGALLAKDGLHDECGAPRHGFHDVVLDAGDHGRHLRRARRVSRLPYHYRRLPADDIICIFFQSFQAIF